jgi:ATP synthase protein I
MALGLVVSTVIGLAIGYGLDVLLGTKPWLMLVFMVLGFAAGMRQMWQAAKREMEHSDDNKDA